MRGRRRYASVLRWYPEAWRDRYGDELEALLEDTYDGGPVPLRTRFSLLRAGSVERLNHRGLGPGGGAHEGVRSGSLVVLSAWAVVVIAGSVFAKTSEHWDRATPQADRRLPSAAYAAVQWAALAGLAVVLVAVSLCLPSLVRSLRQGGWSRVRRPIVRAATLTLVTGVAGAGMVIWAHHLSEPQRNGALWPYSMAAVVGATLMATMIGSWVVAAVDTVVTLRIPDRSLRACGTLALLLTLCTAVVLGGTLAWWWGVAAHAPGFFGQGPTGSPAGEVPVPLTAAAVLMLLGLAAAVCGGWRVLRSLPDLVRG